MRPEEVQSFMGVDSAAPRPAPVIFVVGAGASKAAGGFPLASEAARALAADLKVADELLRIQMKRLGRVFGMPDSFETRLQALTNLLEPGAIRLGLQRLFGKRAGPALIYECIAHLLKHRFIDAVVDFNFDETLDRAIQEEMASSEYARIVSEADCSLVQLGRDRRSRYPIHIKPHGTISQASSLRFTPNHYWEMPDEMIATIKLICGTGAIDVVVIGCSLQSKELRDILAANPNTEKRLFVLNAKDIEAIQGFEGSAFVKQESKQLNSTALGLWKEVEGHFCARYTPRPLLRHQVVTALFSESTYESDKDYYLDRLLVETWIAIARSKGAVMAGHLIQGRPGRFYRDYRAAGDSDPLSWEGILRTFNLHYFGYSNDLLTVNECADDPGAILIVPKDEFSAVNRKLMESVLAVCTPTLRARIVGAKGPVLQLMLDIYDLDEAEFVIRASDRRSHLGGGSPIDSKAALNYWQGRLLNGCDGILAVAETGKWLLDLDARCAADMKRVHVVLAEDFLKEELEMKFPGKFIYQLLPWWEHNQHMAIFLKKNHPIGALMYERRLRNPGMEPVHFDAMECEVPLRVFAAYSAKASKIGPHWRDIFVTKGDVDQKRTEFGV